MNAFGDALNLGFMRGSGDFSSGSMPMDSISDCIPMSSSSPAYGFKTQTAFPWVPIPKPMNSSSGCIPMSSSSTAYGLKTQDAFPWVQVPIPQPMNLRLHSHESLFPANESLDAWVQVPIPCQWISDCIPMSSSSPAKFWSLLVGYHPCPAILIQECP